MVKLIHLILLLTTCKKKKKIKKGDILFLPH